MLEKQCVDNNLEAGLPQDFDMSRIECGLVNVIGVGWMRTDYGRKLGLTVSDGQRTYLVWTAPHKNWQLLDRVRTQLINLINVARKVSGKEPCVL